MHTVRCVITPPYCTAADILVQLTFLIAGRLLTPLETTALVGRVAITLTPPSHLTHHRTLQSNRAVIDLVMLICLIEPHAPFDRVPHSAPEIIVFATPFNHWRESISHTVALDTIITM